MSSLPLGYHLATVLTAAAEEDGDDCDPALLCPHLSKAALLSPQKKRCSSSSKPKLSSRLQLSGLSDANMPYIVNAAALSCFDLVDEDSLWNMGGNCNNKDEGGSSSSCDTTVASSCSRRTSTSSTTTTSTATALGRSSSSWNSFRDDVEARHVMFHAEPTIHVIANKSDLSAEEIRLAWYQEADIARMKQETRHDKQLLQQHQQQKQEHERPWNANTKVRDKKEKQPLQHRRKRASWESASRYITALVSVLEEQERQRLCSYRGANENGTRAATTRNCVWDPELLAQVYRFHSLPAAKEARIVARQQRDCHENRSRHAGRGKGESHIISSAQVSRLSHMYKKSRN